MIRLTALAVAAIAIVCDCTFAGKTKNDKQPHVAFVNKAGTDLAPAAGASRHPILAGIDPAPWHSHGSLYKVLPLEAGVTVLLTGNFGESVEPVAWTRIYRDGRVFCTSLGAPDDFKSPQFQRMLINAIHWGMSRPVGAQIRE